MVWAPVVQTVQTADRSSYLYGTLLWSPAIFITTSGSENGLTFLTTFDLKHQSSFRSASGGRSPTPTAVLEACSLGRLTKAVSRELLPNGHDGRRSHGLVCLCLIWTRSFVFEMTFMRSSWHTSNNTSRESLILEKWNNATFSGRRPSHASWVLAAKGITYPAPVTTAPLSSPDAAQFQKTSLHFLFNHHQNLKDQTECF